MFEFLLYTITSLTLPISNTACVFTAVQKTVVDKLKKPSTLPVSHIGILWKGSSTTAPSSFVRKINLLGMKGPDNYFSIFLPEEAVQTKKNQEGLCVCGFMQLCECVL